MIENEIETLKEEIIKLRNEIVNNSNCLNCGRYGGSFCHRKHAKTFFHKKQSIAIYAPCKNWVSENSKMDAKFLRK